MTTRYRTLGTLSLLATVACSGTTDPGPQVAEVRVSPTTPSVSVGSTVQFSAQAFDASGTQVTGMVPTWRSSAVAVASIDDTGLATALSAGWTDITATIGGVSSSQRLVVEASECTGRIDVVLSAGEHQSYPASECLLLPGGLAGTRYRVAVTRQTLISDSLDVADVTLTMEPVVTTLMAPPAGPGVAAAAISRAIEGGRLDGTAFVRDLQVMARTRAAHRALREREAELGLDPEAMLRAPARTPLMTSHPDPPARDDMYLQLSCTDPAVLKPVRLISFNDDLSVFQDSTEWTTSPVEPAAANQMMAYYSSYAKQMIADYFGTPGDLDGNGRIRVVATTALPEGAAAAVYSGDFFSTASCPSSNVGEVVYFSEEVLNALTAPPADRSFSAPSVLAHEVAHVVSLANGVARGSYHPTWMEEGRAEIAQVMSSRIAWAATGGPPVGGLIDGRDIVEFVNGAGGFTVEIWAIVLELADMIVTLNSHPNSVITNPDGADDGHSFYASSFHFHRLLGDSYGDAATPGADGAFFTGLAASTSFSGFQGLTAATGRSFDQLIEELVVATSAHRLTPIAGPQFTTWDFVSATDIFAAPPQLVVDGVYPWPVTHTGGEPGNPSAPFAAATYSGPIGPAGTRYHDFRSNGTVSGGQIQVTGAGAGGVITILRIQ